MRIVRKKRLGIFVVWLKDAKLQNLLSGRRANIQVIVKVAFTHRYPKLLWEPSTLRNSVILRVCMGIRTNITMVQNSSK